LLDRLHRRGWQVEGQEVDPVAAAAVRERCGHTVHLGELPLLELPGGRYDAIVMSHVIEHLLDPVAILGECRRLLVPSGVLVSVTPNADSFGHREFGRNWLGLDPPRHLHVFTPPSLEAVARAAGFGVATVDTTAAFGAIYAGASLSLARNGRMQGIAGLGWGEHARATLFQLRAHRAWKRDPLSGEELILRASP
jgi:2-polyprenyl-3-methyl-5-hydroxy-6-metoxy-1,4-benzoquinol methylase